MKKNTVFESLYSLFLGSLSKLAVMAVSVIGFWIFGHAQQCSVPNGSIVNASSITDLSSCGGLFTVNGTLEVTTDIDWTGLGAVTLLVEGPNALMSFPGVQNAIYLAAGSQVILANGGLLDVANPCSNTEKIYIGVNFPAPGGSTAFASCAGGGNSIYIFSELNAYASGISINANAPSTVCFGSSLNLTASGSVLNGTGSYTWTGSGPGGFSFNASSANTTVSAGSFTTTGIYTFTARITDALGFYMEQTFSVSVLSACECIAYCVPSYFTGNIDGDNIESVILNPGTLISNVSGINPSNYTVYNTPNPNLNTGATFTLDVQVGSFPSDNGIRAWGDWNGNGVFEPSELIGEAYQLTAFQTATFNFTIPVSATPGTSRIRVMEVYFALDFNPCTSNEFNYGETEDYCITILSNGPSPANDLACGAFPVRTNTNGATPQLNTYGFISDIISCDNPAGNNTFATSDVEGTPCNGTQGLSLWYTFTTPMCDINGAVPFEIELSTNNTGTDFNTKVYLFSSPTNSCADLLQVACNDDHNGIGYAPLCGAADGTTSTVVSSALMPNKQYWVKVDGLNLVDFGDFVLSGRAIAPAHGVQAVGGGTQIQLTTGNMGAQLYTYLYKQVGSTGYSIKNSQTALTDTRTLTPGFSYSTQLMYRCDADYFNKSQHYRTESQNISLELTCAVVSDMTCAFNGPNSYTLTWTQPMGELYTDGGLSGYRIKRSPVGSSSVFTFSNPAVLCNNGTCSVTLPGNSPTGFNWTIETRCSANNVQVGNTTSCGPAPEMPLGNDASNDVNRTMNNGRVIVQQPKTYSFVNAEAGIEFVDVQMHDAYAEFGLNTPMIGDYEIYVNDNNEITWRRVETAVDMNFDFVIVPNPSNAMTTVHLNTVVEAGTFTIVDAMGRTINSGAISNTDKVNIDAAQLQSGVYMVVVTVEGVQMTKRLVVAE